MMISIFLLIAATGLNSVFLFASSSEWSSLINRLEKDGHSKAELEELFTNTDFDPEPVRSKLTSLFESKFSATRIIEIQKGLTVLGYNSGPQDGLIGPKTRGAIRAFQRKEGLKVDGRASTAVLQWIQHSLEPELYPQPDAEEKPSVYKSLLKAERLDEAWEFLQQHRTPLENLRKDYGVPEEIAVAILAVETRVGRYLGKKSAFVTLASLSIANDSTRIQPMFSEYTMTRERRRWVDSTARRISNWAYQELSALLKYSEETGLSVKEIPGSIYGAIGVSQFMPSNALRFAVDGNQDGTANLFEVEDALSSMGNFLKANGWRANLVRRSSQARVIYRYNRSRTYVNTVLAIADELRDRETRAAG
jgi:membrane-bound lytic murein transglycosylase B